MIMKKIGGSEIKIEAWHVMKLLKKGKIIMPSMSIFLQ